MTDHSLQYRADRLRNGNNVHNLNSALAKYFGSIELAKANPTKENTDRIEQYRAEVLRELHKAEIIKMKMIEFEEMPEFVVSIQQRKVIEA